MEFWNWLIARIYSSFVAAPPAFALDPAGQDVAAHVFQAAAWRDLWDFTGLAPIPLQVIRTVCPIGYGARAAAEAEAASRGLPAPPTPAALATACTPAQVALAITPPGPAAALPALVLPALHWGLAQVTGIAEGIEPTEPANWIWAANYLQGMATKPPYAGAWVDFPEALYKHIVTFALSGPHTPPWGVKALPPFLGILTPARPPGDAAEVAFLRLLYRRNPEERLAVLLAFYGEVRTAAIARLLRGRAAWATSGLDVARRLHECFADVFRGMA
jgi:hypothetical protein